MILSRSKHILGAVVAAFVFNNIIVQALTLDRRSCLEYLSTLLIVSGTLDTDPPTTGYTLDPRLGDYRLTPNTNNEVTDFPIMPENVEITDKVFIDVRIARSDGSTYIRDDLLDTFENRVLFQRIPIGLYGKMAPKAVEKFLSYIDIGKDFDIDNPYPSYSRSTFPALDQGTGLLMGGYISSLRAKDVAGSTALTYGSRVLPADLWIGKQSTGRCSHSTKGLLTHKNLDPLPNFGITTRSQPSLDTTHTVFGQILWDADTLKFFRDLEEIPTYAVERPSGYDNDSVTGAVAKSVFNAQREFFRGAAKSMGDDRVGKLYNGKLLRRMEVLKVGRL
jgi:cyclophilin family peptidyl-prolyl cis-trans isomerase